MFHQTPLRTTDEIKYHLRLCEDVLLYFKDSDIPAKVLDARGHSVTVQHGGRFFWVRIDNANVAKIVHHKFVSRI
jgi:hypothetical protein